MNKSTNPFQLILPVFIFLVFTFRTNAQNGAELYQQNCAQCHGADLMGGNATSLVDKIWQFGDGNSYIMTQY